MDYNSMKVVDLKAELKKRGASTGGRKTDLIERLEAYARNSNFGRGEPAVLTDPSIPGWPDQATFRQITGGHKADLPILMENEIECYLQFQQDAKQTGKLKVVEKGEKLVEANRVAACSFVQESNCTFLTGFVSAAMKKKVSYNFKLRVNNKTPVTIENAHCECPAGRGPTGSCKHIAAILLVLAEFTSGDGSLKIPGTCTDQLQTFHRPRKIHQSSPVKIVNLKIQNKRHEIDLDDPRPIHLRNVAGYNDFVRNTITNYVAHTGQDITMRYLYASADLQSAVIDHSYSKLPMTEHWVDRANSVSEREARLIEASTRGQASTSRWQQERAWRLTASQFGRICRITKRCNKEKLCSSLLNPPHLSTPAIRHGKKYEQLAIREFEERFGYSVRPSGLHVRPAYCYLGASPDGIIDQHNIVEVKFPYTGRNEMIKPGKNFKFLESVAGELSLKETHHYFYQVQGQLFLSGAETCHFVVYTFKDIKVIEVNIDEDYCQLSLIPKLQSFYCQYYRNCSQYLRYKVLNKVLNT